MDATDQITGKFSCQRATRRWSKATFENMVDLAVHNSYVLFSWANPSVNLSKRKYIEWLTKELAINNVQRRKSEPRLHNDVVEIVDRFIENYNQHYACCTRPTASCYTCSRNTSLGECFKCKSAVCSEHCKQRKFYICDVCKHIARPTVLIQTTVKRCAICPRVKDRKTSVFCHNCGLFMCSKHNIDIVYYNICDGCQV